MAGKFFSLFFQGLVAVIKRETKSVIVYYNGTELKETNRQSYSFRFTYVDRISTVLVTNF